MAGSTRPTAGPRRRRRAEAGASAVELAFIAPLLLGLLFAIISGGFAFGQTISLNEATGAGARYAATLNDGASWADQVKARTAAYSAGDVSSDQVCAQLVKGSIVLRQSCSMSGSNAVPPASPAGTTATECLVKVWAVREVSFSAAPLWFNDTFEVRRDAVMRYERTCP